MRIYHSRANYKAASQIPKGPRFYGLKKRACAAQKFAAALEP